MKTGRGYARLRAVPCHSCRRCAMRRLAEPAIIPRVRARTGRARNEGILKHREAARFRAAGKGLVERRDLLLAQDEIAGRGILGRMIRRAGFWNRKQ
jgi:hypothetical protein